MATRKKIEKSLNDVFEASEVLIKQVLTNEYEYCGGKFEDMYEINVLFSAKEDSGTIKVEYPFVYRILKKHYDYLRHYRSFLNHKKEEIEKDQSKAKSPFISIEEIDSVRDIVDEYITKYKNLFYSIFNSEYEVLIGGESKSIIGYFRDAHRDYFA